MKPQSSSPGVSTSHHHCHDLGLLLRGSKHQREQAEVPTFNAARSFVGFLALLVVVLPDLPDWSARSRRSTRHPRRKSSRKGTVLGGICCGIALTLAPAICGSWQAWWLGPAPYN